MASFVFPDLPPEVAERIVSLVANQGGFRALGGFLLSGPYGRDLAFSDQILGSIPLTEFINNPKLANKDKKERPFFERCVLARNPEAYYIEGIRLFCQDGNPREALQTLSRSPRPRTLHCKFAIGIFLIAIGDRRHGMRYIRNFESSVPSFEERDLYADQFIEYLGEIRTRIEWGLIQSWEMGFYYTAPSCMGNGCLHNARCQNCYVWYTALLVRQWC